MPAVPLLHCGPAAPPPPPALATQEPVIEIPKPAPPFPGVTPSGVELVPEAVKPPPPPPCLLG